MAKNQIIKIDQIEIVLYSQNKEDFISLTDMARYRDAERTNYIIQNGLRTRNAIEFCGLWEQMYNPNFKRIEFDAFKFEFASWISPEFKLYLITEFQRLKEESNRLKLDWNLQRTLSKINYQIHTDAIKEKLIPPELTNQQINFVYASEADLLNVALFGITAKEWREENPADEGNIRDHATLEQLVVLSNLESINSVLIHQQLNQSERLQQLNQIAISQMKTLLNSSAMKKINR
jgi:hypothetical protein